MGASATTCGHLVFATVLLTVLAVGLSGQQESQDGDIYNYASNDEDAEPEQERELAEEKPSGAPRHLHRRQESSGGDENEKEDEDEGRMPALASAFVAGQFVSAGQCPALAVPQVAQSSPNDRVSVDPATGKRSFNARIVGIFSCMDADSNSNDLTLDIRLAKPAIDTAVELVNKKYPHMHFNVTYRTAPDICRHQQAAGHAADEYYVNGANYFVGPGCSESLASVGQLASYWNVPMCSTGYLPEVVSTKFNPLTLMQLSLSVQSFGEMLVELFQMYKWRHLVIVTDEKHPLHSLIRDGLLDFFHTMYMPSQLSGAASTTAGQTGGAGGGAGNHNSIHHINYGQNHFLHQQKQHQSAGESPAAAASPSSASSTPSPSASSSSSASSSRLPYYINITSRNFAFSSNKPIDYEQIMLEAASYSRIMLLLARKSTIGNLLEAAHNQGMSKGQFVFIAHELFETQQFEAGAKQQQQSAPAPFVLAPNQPTMSRPNYTLDDKIEIQMHGNTSSDQLTREIYQPLMTISLHIPATPDFIAFRSQVADLSEREFNYRIQSSSLRGIYLLRLAAFIYDCVMLYAGKVDFVLRETQFSKIDGKTIFELAAGKTFHGALTGDLNINRAGQRVIDLTLNDFSPKTMTLEPIAHFLATQSERKIAFLPGKAAHWTLRNQSTPRSDPRCREKQLFCLYSDDDELEAQERAYHTLGSDRFVLGVWLLVVIIVSVALTSSIIGWLVYRRFRIESELLNLWWSIKYEDIIFEDEADGLCDGKRSMSSLAISNESFNDRTGGQSQADGQYSLTSGRASPATAQASGRSTALSGEQQMGAAEPPAGQSSPGAQKQLNVCHSLGQDAASVLTAAHSTSTLSVGAPSIGAASANLANPGAAPAGAASSLAQSGSAGRLAANSGAAKLLPLIGKAASGAGSRTGAASNLGQGGSGKGHKSGASAAANAKDPSISSQNKNVKLRLGTVLNGGRDQSYTTKVGLYKASRVAAKHLNVRNLNINRQLLIELRQVRDLTHENLIKFIGLCPEEPNVAIVSELCTRGNLQDLLQNETIRLDWPFRYSIINDIVDGLTHLHASPVQYHGRLKSSNCVIDNRFVVKLTDFGLPTLLAAVEMEENVNPRLLLWTAPEHLRTKHPLLSGSQKGDIYSLAIIFQEIITRCGPFECEPILCGPSELGVPIDWQPQQPAQVGFTNAPLIRTTDTSAGGVTRSGRRGTAGANAAHHQARFPSNLSIQQQQQNAMRFSGLQQQQYQMMPMMQPVVVQHKQRLEPEEIVNLVRMGLSPPFRPYFRPDVAATPTGAGCRSGGAQPGSSQAPNSAGDFNVADLIAIVQQCWQEAPPARPTVTNVKQQIKKMRRGCHLEGANLMDNLLQRMERYTDNLESLVEQKTAELMEEKKRSEELLYEMLPRFVVDQLKYGHSVTPEAYEAVTISFSDIKDFTSIAAQSSPIEVVNLLNQLYTEFDDCIARYDVYKVETIGDAYMVVSGLPVRNGDLHAKEIAEMSLALLDLIRAFEVVHLPHVNLELRIGIHSGPCASGVVGTRMFRYCLFGDTVNTASRMESHGEPMKIHISESSAEVLSKFGTFTIEPRGQIEIKGKGLMNTFWLTGRTLGANPLSNYT